MDDQKRAAYYQEHKDDPGIWDDTEGRDPPSPRRKLGASITVRLSAEEADNLRQMAKAKNVSYAEVIREALKMYAGSGRPLKERVLWVDYRMVSIPGQPRPEITYEPGFNPGPMIPTRSLMPT